MCRNRKPRKNKNTRTTEQEKQSAAAAELSENVGEVAKKENENAATRRRLDCGSYACGLVKKKTTNHQKTKTNQTKNQLKTNQKRIKK